MIGPAYPDARTLSAIVAGKLSDQGDPPSPAGALPAGARLAGALPAGAWLAVPLLAAEPLYLRRPDAREPGPPKRVTPS